MTILQPKKWQAPVVYLISTTSVEGGTFIKAYHEGTRFTPGPLHKTVTNDMTAPQSFFDAFVS